MNALILLFFNIILLSQAFAYPNPKSINAKIENFIKTHDAKGMIYGLWIDGKPVNIHAVGESMTAVPADIEMHIRAGGVTETMLTTILMKMCEEKIINLDNTIEPWYPHLPNASHITLKMLANGTSGLQDYVYNQKFVNEVINHPFKQWTEKELLSYATMNSPLFFPGKSQHYTHTDYVILSSILSRVSHTSIEELYDIYILKKLKMQHTLFNSKTAEMPAPILHSFSQDRRIYEDATFWSPSWTAGSGGIISTILDLGVWGNAWMQGDLLTKASTVQLRAPDTVGKGKNTKEVYFAMGFGVVNHWLIQNPRFGGYSGVLAVLPEKRIVFVAFNTLNETKTETGNLSVALWKQLAAELAPEYTIPNF